jgi:hypothetical protein
MGSECLLWFLQSVDVHPTHHRTKQLRWWLYLCSVNPNAFVWLMWANEVCAARLFLFNKADAALPIPLSVISTNKNVSSALSEKFTVSCFSPFLCSKPCLIAFFYVRLKQHRRQLHVIFVDVF